MYRWMDRACARMGANLKKRPGMRLIWSHMESQRVYVGDILTPLPPFLYLKYLGINSLYADGASQSSWVC